MWHAHQARSSGMVQRLLLLVVVLLLLLLLVVLLLLQGPTLKLISSRLVTRPQRHVCMYFVSHCLWFWGTTDGKILSCCCFRFLTSVD
jgi:hypothetical protein